MKSLITFSTLSLALILGACGDKTGGTKAPANEAEAVAAYGMAKQNLAKFRTCSAADTLADISSYSTELGDTTLSQEDWLTANGKRKGVVTTASGLQYSVNKTSKMTGASMPMPTQTVRVHYHGLFLDGKTFDSSYARKEDIKFPLNGVIKGWTEGVGLMRPCDAWTFYIPSDLAYGPNGRGSIPPATPLVFHVQLLEVID